MINLKQTKLVQITIFPLILSFLWLITSKTSFAEAKDCQKVIYQESEQLYIIENNNLTKGKTYRLQINNANQRISYQNPSTEDGKLIISAFNLYGMSLVVNKPLKKTSNEVIIEEDTDKSLTSDSPDICKFYFNLPASLEEPTESTKKICQGLENPEHAQKCAECLAREGTWTGLGCIPTSNLNEFIKWFLGKIIYIASGIAFLIMVFGAFQIITSSGNPERIQAGKEVITSAVSGLLFIILSLFLLKLIGVDILHIPGFGE